MQGAADVAQNALKGGKMRLSGIMHMKADLLDRIGDIRLGEGEILKSTR
uniref:Uncharacterized protein n=1 Tax=Arundo donax TaxID=35708 RepID=A0A0A9C880_ARUDO